MHETETTVDGVEQFIGWKGRPQKGQPVGLLLRDVDAAKLRERVDSGEVLFVRGKVLDTGD